MKKDGDHGHQGMYIYIYTVYNCIHVHMHDNSQHVCCTSYSMLKSHVLLCDRIIIMLLRYIAIVFLHT